MKVKLFAVALLIMFVFRGSTQDMKINTDKPLEPASFWTSLANDERLEPWRRTVAIYLLHDRHVGKDITLGKLSELLAKPRWLREENVSKVTAGAGWVPLKVMPGDTLFCMLIFPNDDLEKHNRECIGYYLIISGEMETKDLASVLLKREQNKNENRKVKAWAFAPTWDEYVKMIPR